MVFHTSRKRSRFTCISPAKGEYRRTEQLPRLLKLWPNEVEDYSYPGTLKIAALLRKALRGERNRARARHWAYDLTRHLGLIEALKAERARLAMLAPAMPRRAAAMGGAPAMSSRINGTLRLPRQRDVAKAHSGGGALSRKVDTGFLEESATRQESGAFFRLDRGGKCSSDVRCASSGPALPGPGCRPCSPAE
jgi:hypothetical protein